MEKILFFVDGEPYLLEEGIETAITLNITECVEKIKIRFNDEKPEIRPNMNKIWIMLANDIGASIFSPGRCRKTNFSISSFESTFSREVKVFLDTLYPYNTEHSEAKRAYTERKRILRKDLSPYVLSRIKKNYSRVRFSHH